jgi:hypothetical protein
MTLQNNFLHNAQKLVPIRNTKVFKCMAQGDKEVGQPE